MSGRFRKKADHYFDYSLLFIVLFLLGFGLLMIYSTSSYESSMSYNDEAYYLKKQLLATTLGVIVMIAVANMPYHFWERFAIPGYVLSVVLIFAVLSPMGVEVKGARRWLDFGIGFRLQPAEVAKLCMILFLASMVCKMGNSIKSWKGFLTVLGVPAPIALFIWKITDNLSSAIIVMGIAFLMLFVASPEYKKFLAVTFVCIVGAAITILTIANADAETLGFRGERVLAWLNPEAYASGKGFQTLQALYAIGSGGIFGKGLGESMQKLGFIPEAQNDMIFSIICEELGLFGAACVIMLFVLMIWRFMVIANNAPDLFGALLVVGVLGHIAIQVILNIAVVTNVIPNTGISLPFISYGGSSVLFLLTEIGLVLNVSKSIRLS